MKTLRNLILLLLVIAGGVGYWIYSGAFDVSANQSPSAFEDRLLSTIKERSILRRAAEITVPPQRETESLAEGFEIFRTHCVACHGAPGLWPQALAMGLYPVPPSLDSPRVQDRSDAYLFWVMKNGVKLTGMPAFGPSLSDEDLGTVLTFIRQLPKLSPNAILALSESAPAPQLAEPAPPAESP